MHADGQSVLIGPTQSIVAVAAYFLVSWATDSVVWRAGAWPRSVTAAGALSVGLSVVP